MWRPARSCVPFLAFVEGNCLSSVLTSYMLSFKARLYEGLDTGSGAVVVALKAHRVSTKYKRTLMQHESRVLEILQGHPSIPKLLGYCRPPHFEYVAMELLGDSLFEKIPRGAAAQVETIIRIALKMVST